MIILKSCNTIVYHIPKCGGTTFSKVFRQYLLEEDLIILSNNRLAGSEKIKKKINSLNSTKPLKHSTHQKAIQFLEHIFPNTSFTHLFIGRNPIDRTVSAYKFLRERFKQTGLMHNGNVFDIKSMKFSDFLNSHLVGEYGRISAHPQTKWLPNTEANKKIIFKLEDIKDRQKFDELVSILPYYKDKIQIDDFQTFHSNRSYHKKKQITINRQSTAAIKEIYGKDFLNFGYDV